jgi:predicted AlkP superfamily phosphohydrolase/phosphomutase
MLTVYMYGELLHAFWKFHDPRHPDFRAAGDVFGGEDPIVAGLRELDALLAELVQLAGPRALVLVLGAWGHRMEHSRVQLNAVLEREGYLHFHRHPRARVKHALYRLGVTAGAAERLAHRLNIYRHIHYGASRASRSAVTGATFLSYQDVDWARTRAIAIGYLGQVYLNVGGHRPLGVIPPERYEEEREHLRAVLTALRHPLTGAEMVERVFTRDEIYDGAERTNAPDLVIDWKEGFVGSGGFAEGRKLVTDSPPNHSSDHWRHSVMLASGAGVRAQRRDVNLEDVTPTILRALGVDSAEQLDGRVVDLWAERPGPSDRVAPP